MFSLAFARKPSGASTESFSRNQGSVGPLEIVLCPNTTTHMYVCKWCETKPWAFWYARTKQRTFPKRREFQSSRWRKIPALTAEAQTEHRKFRVTTVNPSSVLKVRRSMHMYVDASSEHCKTPRTIPVFRETDAMKHSDPRPESIMPMKSIGTRHQTHHLQAFLSPLHGHLSEGMLISLKLIKMTQRSDKNCHG